MPTYDPVTGDALGNETRQLLYIDRYWERKQQCPNGQFIEFPPFKVGGCSWTICYYPNGASSISQDYISIFIALEGRVDEAPVRARTRFNLFDWAGKPVPGNSTDTDVREFSDIGQAYGCEGFIRKDFLEASEHLADDCLIIMCDVSVDRATPPSCGLQQHLHDVLAATDVRFLVGGETFSAHKCVLEARSPAFVAELFTGDTTTRDCIRIDDMPAQVFKNLLHFIYTDSLPEMSEQEESMMAEHLLAAADRFDLPELKLICENILSSEINENTVTQILDLAIGHRCETLHDDCIEFLEDHPALDAVMAADDGSLLEHVAKSCPQLLKDLCADCSGSQAAEDQLPFSLCSNPFIISVTDMYH
ncbi:hypothetical protein QOZ80_2BG0165170 [Eleusine coracana subsp. coracana]|nr:hypothetical protein QOZ80_2BG0165170 [Eleusine coracana subsp. coracana]